MDTGIRFVGNAIGCLADCANRSYLTSVLLEVRMMSAPKRITTTVSTKGQVILPKAVRERRKWTAGTRLIVEETEDGVLLKPAPLFAPTRVEDVAGMLRYSGPPKTIEEMDEGIAIEVKRRHARGRY